MYNYHVLLIFFINVYHVGCFRCKETRNIRYIHIFKGCTLQHVSTNEFLNTKYYYFLGNLCKLNFLML